MIDIVLQSVECIVCVRRPPKTSIDAELVDSSEDEGVDTLKTTKVDIDLGLSAYANACK